MVHVRIRVPIVTFVPQIRTVLHIACAMMTLMTANANTDTTNQNQRPNAFVTLGVHGRLPYITVNRTLKNNVDNII